MWASCDGLSCWLLRFTYIAPQAVYAASSALCVKMGPSASLGPAHAHITHGLWPAAIQHHVALQFRLRSIGKYNMDVCLKYVVRPFDRLKVKLMNDIHFFQINVTCKSSLQNDILSAGCDVNSTHSSFNTFTPTLKWCFCDVTVSSTRSFGPRWNVGEDVKHVLRPSGLCRCYDARTRLPCKSNMCRLNYRCLFFLSNRQWHSWIYIVQNHEASLRALSVLNNSQIVPF